MNAVLRLALIAACALLATSAAAQGYQTPGFGVDWTLDDLVANSGGAVLGGAGQYTVTMEVTIAATDRLEIAPGTTITFVADPDVGLTVAGILEAIGTADARIVFTGADPVPGSWRGLDFIDTIAGSIFRLEHCEVAYADEAIDAFEGDIELRHCEVRDSLSKAIDITAAGGLVSNCHLHHNRARTITMTLTASPTIEDCLLEDNNLDNSSPYPYLNIGLQGVNSPTITGNHIIGSGNHMSGGIAIWNASNATIEGNIIEGCGYGILCYQTGANPVITGNQIRDNNIHPDTVNWGFGVACNGNNAPILMGNQITGHWYGVAAVNGGRPNLGDLVNDFPGDDGGNIIELNGLGGQTYGFYNNTPLDQMAQGNWWGAADAAGVEDAIFHQVDDPSLGLVNFDFFLTAVAAPAPRADLLSQVTAYPNPFNPQVSIAFTLARAEQVAVTVLDMRGRLVRELLIDELAAGPHAVTWNGTDRGGRPLASGVYFYRVTAGNQGQAGRLVLVR